MILGRTDFLRLEHCAVGTVETSDMLRQGRSLSQGQTDLCLGRTDFCLGQTDVCLEKTELYLGKTDHCLGKTTVLGRQISVWGRLISVGAERHLSCLNSRHLAALGSSWGDDNDFDPFFIPKMSKKEHEHYRYTAPEMVPRAAA